MGEEIYEELLYLSVFLGSLWVAGYFCHLIKISPILGQILIGILLGPNGLDFVPLFDGSDVSESGGNASESIEEELFFRLLEGEEEEGENFLEILGVLGVTLLILESGLHVDFKTLREVGASAFFVAVIGTFMPILMGIGLASVIGFDPYPEGLAIGAVMAPTSVGIALKLLHEAHVLDSRFGQTIVTAAFTDDIFSLVTLAVLLELAEGNLNAGSFLKPLSSAFGFIAAAFLVANYVIPYTIPPFLVFIDRKFGQVNRDIVHLSLMFAFLGVYGFIGDLIGSHLLGAFLSGITFCKVPRTHLIWSRDMDVINTWLLAIFFGATVAFVVPVEELISLEAFWKGLVIGIGPGIIGKVMSGLALKKRWVVGWAMVGRGEFAFLVAQTLKETIFQEDDQFLSDEGFGVAVWALLVATIVAPIAFGFVLASQLKKDEAEKLENANLKDPRVDIKNKKTITTMKTVLFNAKDSAPRSEWVVTIGCKYQKGLLIELMNILSNNHIHVKSYVNEGEIDLKNTLMTMVIAVPDPSEESARATNVNLKQSFRRLRSEIGEGEDEALRFKDNYFSFDIERYIGRIRASIEKLLTSGDATVKIERAEEYAPSRAQATAQPFLPPDSAIIDDDEGDDEDSIPGK